DEWVVTVPERVSDMNNIPASEVDVDVAVGMSGCIVFERDLLSVEFEGALAGKGITGNCAGGRRRKCEVPALYTRVLRKVLAGVLMGKDRCAGRVQPFIPVRVVEVPVRVDEVFDGVGANARRSVGNLRPGSCKTGVDEKLTVATGEDGDVAPGTHQDA